MVGKTLKSKINGDLFVIDNEFTDNGRQFYLVRHLPTGKVQGLEKGWFEHGLMQNLEVVTEGSTMKKINHVDRYGTYTGDYMYFVHYENGDIDQYGSENMPKAIYRWMAAADFQFRRNKKGEYYHRFA